MSPNQELVWGGGASPHGNCGCARWAVPSLPRPSWPKQRANTPRRPRNARHAPPTPAARLARGPGAANTPPLPPSPAPHLRIPAKPRHHRSASLQGSFGDLYRLQNDQIPPFGWSDCHFGAFGEGRPKGKWTQLSALVGTEKRGEGGGPRSPTSGMGDCGFRPPLMPHATPSRGHEGGCRAAARPPHARLPPHGPLMVHEGLDYA